MDKFVLYLKAIVSAVGGIALLGYVAWQDKAISLDEAEGIWAAVIAALTVAGVYAAPRVVKRKG
jgi:hypothetical protein